MPNSIISAAILLVAASNAGNNARICDPTRYVSNIEPDMQYTEDEFNYENYRWAIDWLRSAEWKQRVEGKTYSAPFELGWEFEMAYFNRLTQIEGFVLKQRALLASEPERPDAVHEFCTFLINAVPLD